MALGPPVITRLPHCVYLEAEMYTWEWGEEAGALSILGQNATGFGQWSIQGTSLMLTIRLDRVVGNSTSGVGGFGSLGVRFDWSGCLFGCVGLSGQWGLESPLAELVRRERSTVQYWMAWR